MRYGVKRNFRISGQNSARTDEHPESFRIHMQMKVVLRFPFSYKHDGIHILRSNGRMGSGQANLFVWGRTKLSRAIIFILNQYFAKSTHFATYLSGVGPSYHELSY